MVTAGQAKTLAQLKRAGLTAEEIELATEPRQQIDSTREAWQYAADLLAQVEQAEQLDLDHVPLAFQPQAQQLQDWLSVEVVQAIRMAWQKRKQELQGQDRKLALPPHKIVSVRGLQPNSPGIVYCGRPCAGWAGSPLANPVKISETCSRNEAIEEYGKWLAKKVVNRNAKVLRALKQITAESVLGCWCFPLACHCEVISRVWRCLKAQGTI
jgi:hypothetical protein